MKANKTSKGYDLNYIQYLNDNSLASDIKEEKKACLSRRLVW